MASNHFSTFGLGPDTPSRFAASSPALFAMGLQSTGLTPQGVAPIATGTHHKLEINPFESSYAGAGRKMSLDADQLPLNGLRRPRINELQNAGAGPGKDSSSSSDSRSSNESRLSLASGSRATSSIESPPSDVPRSPKAVKPATDSPMLSLDAIPNVIPQTMGLPIQSGIDANAYAEHLARYVQAQAVHNTRTSAPLAGRSTSRPQAQLNTAAMVIQDEIDPSLPSAHSPESDDSPTSPAMLPAAMSAVQMPAAAPPRKKAPSSKPGPPVKRGKVGRPRNIKEEEDGDDLTAEEVKRRDFLERNRQAACKSRQKRKAWQANLETEAARLTESNGHLQALVANLREEIASLRATVAGHAANGCQAARLALQAARPGDVPMAAFVLPSPSQQQQQSFSPSMSSPQHHGGDIVIGGGQSMEAAMAAYQQTPIEVQRSTSSGMHELSPSMQGAGAVFYNVAGPPAPVYHHLGGRPTDVDLSAYLA